MVYYPMSKVKRSEAVRDLCRLHAVGEFDDPGNMSAHDGHYAVSLENKWHMSLDKLAELVGFDEMMKKYQRAKKRAAKAFEV
jgi:hypothetical protein